MLLNHYLHIVAINTKGASFLIPKIPAAAAIVIRHIERLAGSSNLRFIKVLGHLNDNLWVMVVDHASLNLGQDVDYMTLVVHIIKSFTMWTRAVLESIVFRSWRKQAIFDTGIRVVKAFGTRVHKCLWL